MISKLLEKLGFKKKKTPLYTKRQFTKYANYKGDTYVYDSYSNQWLLWYLIADSVDDGSVSEFDMIKDNPHDIMENKTYNTEDWMGEETTLNIIADNKVFPEYKPVDSLSDLEKALKSDSYRNFDIGGGYSESSNSSESSSSNNSGYSGDSYSSSSDSYSSSSYDSSSSSSFSSSDSGGGCF